jgi:hypothetical protein
MQYDRMNHFHAGEKFVEKGWGEKQNETRKTYRKD